MEPSDSRDVQRCDDLADGRLSASPLSFLITEVLIRRWCIRTPGRRVPVPQCFAKDASNSSGSIVPFLFPSSASKADLRSLSLMLPPLAFFLIQFLASSKEIFPSPLVSIALKRSMADTGESTGRL